MRETYEVFIPANKTYEDVVDLMRSWSSLPKPHLGRAIQAICLDRFADYSGEHLYLTIAGRTSARVDELFYQQLDATLEPVEYDPIAETSWDSAVELALSGYNVPLRIGTPTGVAGTFSAHLKNIPEGHSVCMQFVISAEDARTPTADDRDKVTDHTFNVIVRLGAAGERAEHMVQDLISPFRSIESHRTKFRFRRLRQVPGRLNRRAATWGFSGLYNVSELPPMIFRLDGTGEYKARRLTPSYVHQTEGIVLGYSNAPKMADFGPEPDSGLASSPRSAGMLQSFSQDRRPLKD
jgi:hypothetical protein